MKQAFPSQTDFEEITLLQTRFHKVTVHELIASIVQFAKLDRKTVVAHVNVRGLNFAYVLDWYRNFLNGADLVFCDGFGVILGARLKGCALTSENRMTCPDYIEDLAIACAEQDVSLFLLAGKPGIVDQAIPKLKAVAPALNVQGHHGYFQKEGPENDAVIAKINQVKPDVLYIGFGMPLQEKWILDHFEQIDTKVFLPLGACLDFYTGNTYRGPRWATDRGLEWLTRLFTEPHRLWDRYIVGNPLFFYRVIKEKMRL